MLPAKSSLLTPLVLTSAVAVPGGWPKGLKVGSNWPPLSKHRSSSASSRSRGRWAGGRATWNSRRVVRVEARRVIVGSFARSVEETESPGRDATGWGSRHDLALVDNVVPLYRRSEAVQENVCQDHTNFTNNLLHRLHPW